MVGRPSRRGAEFLRNFTLEKRTHVAYPTYFLQQAAVAFDGGSTLGTSILCRASLEAAYCFFLQYAVRSVTGSGFDMAGIPHLLPGQRKAGDRVDFKGVMHQIKESGLLTPVQLLASRRIRDNGNWIAHIVQVTERERLQSPDPLHWTSWIDDNRAWADLEDTADILRAVEGAFPSIYR